MTSSEAIAAYVGYFTVLWISWFLVGLYDVRFVTDSFFGKLVIIVLGLVRQRC